MLRNYNNSVQLLEHLIREMAILNNNHRVKKLKSKAIPGRGRGGRCDCQMSRFRHFLDSLLRDWLGCQSYAPATLYTHMNLPDTYFC
jgi:hypothetical protein